MKFYKPYRYGDGIRKFWSHMHMSEPIALYSCILGAIGCGLALGGPEKPLRIQEQEARQAHIAGVFKNKTFKEM